MSHLIPLARRLAEIEGRAARIKRRIEMMTGEIDFLADTMISRPWQDMTAQKRLLDEWSEEVDRLERDLEYLRTEWIRIDAIVSSRPLHGHLRKTY